MIIQLQVWLVLKRRHVPSSQFCCEPKTALNKVKVFFFKETNKAI